MTANFFVSLTALLGLFASVCLAEEYSDTQLMETAKRIFTKSVAGKSAVKRIQIIRDEFAPLSQAQRTRAMVLWLYDLDAKSRRPGQHVYPGSPIRNAMAEDPELLADPSELKRMIAAENDPRKFYIMSAPASQLMHKQKADFVVEMSHMLFRHGPVASTVHSDYYRPYYEDASYAAYVMITGNLHTLEAGFVPPDEKLPYEKRIPVLVDWLRHNWPGCEKLGLEEKATQSPAPSGETREERKPRGTQADATSEKPYEKSWLEVILGAALVGMLGYWFLLRPWQKRQEGK